MAWRWLSASLIGARCDQKVFDLLLRSVKIMDKIAAFYKAEFHLREGASLRRSWRSRAVSSKLSAEPTSRISSAGQQLPSIELNACLPVIIGPHHLVIVPRVPHRIIDFENAAPLLAANNVAPMIPLSLIVAHFIKDSLLTRTPHLLFTR
jgi:hypothetical protein